MLKSKFLHVNIHLRKINEALNNYEVGGEKKLGVIIK